MTNYNDIGPDITQFIPPTPKRGISTEETLANYEQWFKSFAAGMYEYRDHMKNRANVGFTEITVDGVEYDSSNGGSISITSGTFTYQKTGDELNALTGMIEGDVCYVTLDSTSGTDRFAAYTYRYDGASWDDVGTLLKSTQVSAGEISLINGVAASTVQGGADKANGGLDALGTVKRHISSVEMTGGVTPGNDGLYMTTDYLGFWDQSETAWAAYIKSDGNFYFGGDGDNYIAWDGSNLTILCTYGYMGSSTTYMNITDGVMQLKGSSSYYCYLESDGVYASMGIYAGAAGTNPIVLCNQSGINVYSADAFQPCGIHMKDGSGNNIFEASTNTAFGYKNIILKTGAGMYIDMDETRALMVGFQVGGNSNTVDGNIRFDSGELQVYKSGWKNITTA